MKKTFQGLLVCLLLLGCTVSVFAGDKKNVLKAFEIVRASTKSGSDYSLYCRSLTDAEAELQMYIRITGQTKVPITDKFTLNIAKANYLYETARLEWGNENYTGREKTWREAAKYLNAAYKYLK